MRNSKDSENPDCRFTAFASCDPWADPEEVKKEYGIDLSSDLRSLTSDKYSALVLAVAHDEFKKMSSSELSALRAANSVVYDIKSILPVAEIDGRL